MRIGSLSAGIRHCRVHRIFVPVLIVVASIVYPSGGAGQVFQLEWGSVGSAAGEFNRPQGIAINDSGFVYVADTDNHRIQRFDKDGLFEVAWGDSGSLQGQFNKPTDVAIGTGGRVYVTDQGNDRIQVFDAVGNFLNRWGTRGAGNGQFAKPSGLFVAANDWVYVADSGNKRIQVFTAAGGFLATLGSMGGSLGRLDNPVDVMVDDSTRVYVVDSGRHRVLKYKADGTFVITWGASGSAENRFDRPISIAADRLYRLLVADTYNNRIQRFDRFGEFITTWGQMGNAAGQFTQPRGVAMSSENCVYVVDSGNNRIQKFVLNEPPQALVDTVTGTGGLPLTIFLAGTDADSDSLTATITSPPVLGELYQTTDGITPAERITDVPTLVSDAQRRVIFLSAAKSSGLPYAYVKFSVADANAQSESVRLDIHLNSENNAPIIGSAIVVIVHEAETATIYNGNLRVTDTEDSAQDVVFHIFTEPQHGTLVPSVFNQQDINNGRVQYVHNGGEATIDNIGFRVEDSQGGVVWVTLPVKILPVNDPPVLAAVDNAQVNEGELLNILFDIMDDDATDLMLLLEPAPPGVVITDGLLSWVPDYSQSGYYKLRLTVADEHGASVNRRFDIQVVDVEPPPLSAVPLALDFGPSPAGAMAVDSLVYLNPLRLPLTISSLNADGEFSVMSPTPPIVMAGGDSVVLTITFTPTFGDTIPASGTLGAVTNYGDLSVLLSGNSRWTRSSLDREELDFGIVPTGSFADIQMSLMSEGTVPLVTYYSAVTDPQFKVSMELFSVESGSKHVLNLVFAPERSGRVDAVLNVTTSDTVLQVALTGVGGDPLTLDFGARPSGQVVERHVRYVNPLAIPLTISSLVAEGDFVPVVPKLPVVIAPNDSIFLTTTFTPTFGDSSQASGILRAGTELGDFTVLLSGSSVWTRPTLNTQALDFGAVGLGTSKDLLLLLTQEGTAQLVVDSITVTNTQFSVPGAGFLVPAGESKILRPVFVPGRIGPAEEVMHIVMADTVFRVALTGWGGEPFDGAATLDFNLLPGDQLLRDAGYARAGREYDLQAYITGAPDLEGWSARLVLDDGLSLVGVHNGDLLPRTSVHVVPGKDHLLLETQSVRGRVGRGDGTLSTLTLVVREVTTEKWQVQLSHVVLQLVGGGNLSVTMPAAATVTLGPTSGFLSADFDQDGAVGFADFFLFAAFFGQQVPPAPVKYDLAEDSQISFADFFAFADLFGQRGGDKAKLLALAAEVFSPPPAPRLGPNWPNPFNAVTVIGYALTEVGSVRLAIYDMTGQQVRELVNSMQPAGVYRVIWDGRNTAGNVLGSGVYVGRLEIGGFQQTRKMLLIK